MQSPTSGSNGMGGAPGIKIPTVPLMRTQAEQVEINQTRIDAELYQLQIRAGVQQQQQDFAEFMGRSFRRGEEKQAHNVYNVFYNGPEKKPPPDPDPPEPIGVRIEVQALREKLEAEKEISREKLHEATSAAKLTVNQHMLDTIAERVKVERLKVALNASTDEIRRGRAAQSFNEQLTTELKETRQTANSSNMEADRLNTEKEIFWSNK